MDFNGEYFNSAVQFAAQSVRKGVDNRSMRDVDKSHRIGGAGETKQDKQKE